jgi:ATP-dependent helicase/nuclease subunit A
MKTMLDAFRQHAIWNEVQTAGDVRTEYTFALVDREKSDAADGTPAVPTLTRGTIDLIYRTDDHWTLVDFKSDRLSDENPGADAQRRAQGAYTDQIRGYAAAWEALQHEPVERAGLWFASNGQFVDIDL